ncbi:hypothetical protein [Argonema antarcticum]|uniref:hypothetical protein n=1 Tax=Argonema antarcticum TaxID=2942763 RepID=UPI0020125621|nr:hypothetical protein [Argonema antarcticum]MCL1472874.1 hypothetical protein [Argonema antarcticum A004/B2]
MTSFIKSSATVGESVKPNHCLITRPVKQQKLLPIAVFPNHTLGSLLPAQLRQAENVCRQAGVQADLLEGCIFDVGSTGEAGFAKAAANAFVDIPKQRLQNEIQRRIPIPGIGF